MYFALIGKKNWGKMAGEEEGRFENLGAGGGLEEAGFTGYCRWRKEQRVKFGGKWRACALR